MAYEGNPDWPVLFTTNTVHAKYVQLDGTPQVGTVTFVARPAVLKVIPSDVTVVPVPLVKQLDPHGNLLIEVPVTDDDNVRPENWTYEVTENFPGGQTYDIYVPTGDSIDLLLVSPTQPSIGIVQYFGPPGPFADVIDGGAP